MVVGLYGSSRYLISSSVRVTSTAAASGSASVSTTGDEKSYENAPMISSKLDNLVVPTIGAVTPSFARHHATAICAIVSPFFFASSSTLASMSQNSRMNASKRDAPGNDLGCACADIVVHPPAWVVRDDGRRQKRPK